MLPKQPAWVTARRGLVLISLALSMPGWHGEFLHLFAAKSIAANTVSVRLVCLIHLLWVMQLFQEMTKLGRRKSLNYKNLCSAANTMPVFIEVFLKSRILCKYKLKLFKMLMRYWITSSLHKDNYSMEWFVISVILENSWEFWFFYYYYY